MQFEYLVVDQKNQKLRGTLEAASMNEAKALLREKKLLIIDLKGKTASAIQTRFTPGKKGKLSFNQLVDFTRQMGIMINAGLSLVDALDIIASQAKNANEQAVIGKIEEYIKSGSPLSTAMQNFSETFPGYYISLVRAGESSGKLDDVFSRLAENLERAREFRGKLVGALIYPVIIIVGIMVVAFVMMTFVLPRLLDLYENFNVELPITTQIIISLSNFSSQFWPIILIGTAALIIGGRFLIQKPENRKKIDQILLTVPVFGSIIQKGVLVESTRTLSILVKSGVPLLEAIEIITNTTTNEIYKSAFGKVHQDIEKGKTLGDALADTQLFPQIFVQMTSVGERTGQLDDTLMRLSRYFQLETELAIKAATTLIEPLILVVLGVGVGFLVLSILTPIYNLTSSFGAG